MRRGAVPAAGRIRLGLILGLAVAAVGIYGGTQLAWHYWAYWNLREEAERWAIEGAAGQAQEAAIRRQVVLKGREYGIQFREEDIQTSLQSGAVSVSFAWQTSVELPGYSHPLYFQVNVSSRRVR